MAPPADRARRRRAAALAVVACIGAAGAGRATAAGAQADGGATRLLEQFGGFELSARGNGIQLTYDSPGVVPVGPAVQVSVPEALATSSSGTNYALASVAYPGPVLADLPTVLAQSNPDLPQVAPPYPVRAQAFFPSGPTSEERSTATARMRSVTDALTSLATASSTGTDVAPLVAAGSVAGASRTGVEQGKVTSRARVETTGTDLLGGLLHVESVVTDLVAASDGAKAGTDGRTTVNGVTFLGLAATVDRDGLRLVERPPAPDDPPGPLDPLLEPIVEQGPPPVGDATAPLAERVNGLVTSTLGAGATLGDLLEENGMKVRVLDPVETADKGTATRTAYGLQVELSYSASGDPRIAPLLTALLPAGRLPAECPVPGAPVDCSPEGLLSLLTRTHITDVGIGAAEVEVAATGAFQEVDLPLAAGPLPAGTAGAPAGSLPSGTEAGFTTPAPSLAGPTGHGASAARAALSALGRALPAALVLLVVLSAPLWAGASRRLADAVLAGGGDRCPDGLDRRPRPPRGG